MSTVLRAVFAAIKHRPVLPYPRYAFKTTSSRSSSYSHPIKKYDPYANQYPRSPTPQQLTGHANEVSPILSRDLCQCPACLDPSTKQKLFSTADIPSNIDHASVEVDAENDCIHIKWEHDVPSYPPTHTTTLDRAMLRRIQNSGTDELPFIPPRTTPWMAQTYRQLQDFSYEAYMQDDAVLSQALNQLHTFGLMFLTGVPDNEQSVSTIGERIGPLKNTFYGFTWDVRSVPDAKNVAYTSQDLGFHMDLLYMHQPPHLQLLHCIRSSSSGGASLFTDSLQSAADLFANDIDKFAILAKQNVTFHYDHPTAHLYRQSRPVFELKASSYDGHRFDSGLRRLIKARERQANDTAGDSVVSPMKPVEIINYLASINWSPPFQGPFGFGRKSLPRGVDRPDSLVGTRLADWHKAAQLFSQLIHRPEGIYDRLMKPGECVIFDNRRVLHARRAFDVADAGKERWLRGAYVDYDPFMSKMRVLAARLG